jgi:hypothetical protein
MAVYRYYYASVVCPYKTGSKGKKIVLTSINNIFIASAVFITMSKPWEEFKICK